MNRTVRLLLSRGSELDARTRDGATALMIGAGSGHVGAVRTLLEAAGANTGSTDASGHTPLVWGSSGRERGGGADSAGGRGRTRRS